MKKVVFLTPSLQVGGMERVLVTYANLFVKYGYDVTIFNFTGDSEVIVKNLDERIHYVAQYAPVKHLFRASLKDIFNGSSRFLPWNKWIAFHSPEYLHKKYFKDHYDIEISFFGVEAAKIVNGASGDVKTLTWIHNEKIDGLIENGGGKNKTKKIFQNSQNLICVSENVKKKMIEEFGTKQNSFVVNNPINAQKIRALAQEKDGPQKQGFTFITVSRLIDSAKGYIRLLETCKRLVDEGFTFYLWVVGEGIDGEKIRHKAKDLSLDNVCFFGEQENPYKYMNQADMYLCSSYHEGFSISMMEAIALAKPIMTTEVSGVNEMLAGGKYGMIVDNTDEALYKGMKEILLQPSLYNYYQQKANERKDYSTEDSIMKQIENLLGERR